jgi:hypothetical protein
LVRWNVRQYVFQLAMQCRHRRECPAVTTRMKADKRFVDFFEQVGRTKNELPKRRPESPRHDELPRLSQDA